jgi:hypothetical protein
MSRRSYMTAGAVLLVVIAASAGVGASVAAFSARTTNSGSSLNTDALAAPTNLTASGIGFVNLTWKETDTTWASGYRVYRARTSGGPYSQIAQVVGRSTTSYTDGPILGTRFYVVRAYYNGTSWTSPDSNEASN